MNSTRIRTTTRSGLATLIVVVVGIALAGCARDVGEAPPSPEAPNRTTAHEGPADATRTPESVLILGKHAATGVPGTCCWESASGASETVSRCADAAGIPVSPEEEALTVPRSWVLVFDYGGIGWSASVDVGAYPLERGGASPPGPGRGAPLTRDEVRLASETKDLRASHLARASANVHLYSPELPEGVFSEVGVHW